MLVPESTTEEGFEQHFGINYLGHFLLTSLLLDTLKQSGQHDSCSRIVTISSSAHHMGHLKRRYSEQRTFPRPWVSPGVLVMGVCIWDVVWHWVSGALRALFPQQKQKHKRANKSTKQTKLTDSDRRNGWRWMISFSCVPLSPPLHQILYWPLA